MIKIFIVFKVPTDMTCLAPAPHAALPYTPAFFPAALSGTLSCPAVVFCAFGIRAAGFSALLFVRPLEPLSVIHVTDILFKPFQPINQFGAFQKKRSGAVLTGQLLLKGRCLWTKAAHYFIMYYHFCPRVRAQNAAHF